MKLNNHNKKQLFKDLLISCKTGDLDFVKKIIDSKLDNQITSPIPNEMLEHASGFGHIEIIKLLFESESFKKHIDNEITLKHSVEKAFLHGRIESVQFLAPKLEKFGIDYNDKVISSGISDAVMNGQFEMVKFLIETPPIKTTLNKDFFIERAINLGAIYDRVDILKYAIDQDQLKYFNTDKDNLVNTFWGALTNGSMNAIKYFIFDLNIEKTEDINEILNNKDFSDYEAAKTMFQIRDNHKSLTNELQSSDTDNQSIKKPKI